MTTAASHAWWWGRMCCLLVLVAACGCGGDVAHRAYEDRESGGAMIGALDGPIRTVVVDAGHGGFDPGAMHHGIKEKDLALDIARRLKRELAARGLRVLMTRDSDRFIELTDRAALGNRDNADLFISVHLNANLNSQVSGAEVYFPRESVLTGRMGWPPYVQLAEIAIASTSVKHALWDLVLGRARNQSQLVATDVCAALRHGLDVSCESKPARFVVLRESRMPAILVEIGYISNYGESQRIGDAAYRQAAAVSVARGVVSYIRALGAQHI